MNSGQILVTPGSPFTITFRARINPISVGSGYSDIIFLNASGEVSRLTAPFEAGPVVLAETTTDANGAYVVNLDNVPAGAFDLVAWYAGSDALWPARALVAVRP